jgi:menaquinone-dependent protoporphyrinogen oxidase
MPVRRDRDGAGNDLSAVLVLYASVEGHTERIARRVAERLRSHGHRVEVAPAGAPADLARYDGVIVGASVHYGRHPSALARWLRGVRFEARPSAFFSVSLGAKPRYAARFLRKTRWQPQLVGVFRGALKYSLYGPLKKLVVRAFAAVAGHDTDPSRDYDYTDWKAVDAFAAAFAERLTSAS